MTEDGAVAGHLSHHDELRLEITKLRDRRRAGLLRATFHDGSSEPIPIERPFVVPIEAWEVDAVASALEITQPQHHVGAAPGHLGDLGARLFGGTIAGPAIPLYATAVEKLRSAGSRAGATVPGLCVRIVVDSAMAGDLPWELLFDVDLQKDFLSHGRGISIVRGTPDGVDRMVRPIAGRPRLLLATAGVEKPGNDLLAGLATSADVEHHHSLPPDELLARIRRRDLNIVWLLGAMPEVAPDELAAAAGHGGLTGVLLEGRRSDRLARRLAASVPLVLGIRAEMSIATRAGFRDGFLRSLLAGAPVAAAVKAGRSAVVAGFPGDPSWAAPVVYTWTIGPLVAAAAEPVGSPEPVRELQPAARPVASAAQRRLDLLRSDLHVIVEQWKDYPDRSWPALVRRRRDALVAEIKALKARLARPVPPAAPPSEPVEVSGPRRGQLRTLALFARRYDVCLTTLGELDELVTELAPGGLVAVAGERRAADEAAEQLARARQILTSLADADRGEAPGLLAELGRLLAPDYWMPIADLDNQLRLSRDEQRLAVEEYDQEIGIARIRVNQRISALHAARQAGAVIPEHSRVIMELNRVLTEAERDRRAGHFDRVHRHLVRLVELQSSPRVGAVPPVAGGDPIDPHQQFLDELKQLETAALVLGTSAELQVLTSTEEADDQKLVRYRTVLRLPASNIQESHVQGSSVLVPQDHQGFNQIVGAVAAQIQGGARSDDVDEPGPSPEPDGPRPGATRGFLTGRADSAGPAAAIEDDLRDVGQLMYHLIVPDTMQRLLGDTDAPLSVATNDLQLPWELMHDGEDFLCLRRPLARRPVGGAFPRRPRGSDTAFGDKLHALFVGCDPRGDLPSAIAEVDAISKALREHPDSLVELTVLLGPDATGERLNRELLSGRYHVVHFAGHAGFDADHPERSALLLHGEEPYFAQKIERLLAGSPLVFLNACETSATANPPDPEQTTFGELTQGLAAAFLYGGAPACVGSLWPVRDDSAHQLAVTFYNKLFYGTRVGEALRSARYEQYDAATDRFTWASYALYGDPTFRLQQRLPGPEEG